MRAVLTLIAARAGRRGGRGLIHWLLPVLGIALATAFAGAVAAESTIAGDQAARSSLNSLSPLDRAVRITWQGVVTPGVAAQARTTLRSLGLGAQTEVLLLWPVRLGGIVVRPAAIAPLSRWVSGAAPGPCRASGCPMLLVGGTLPRSAGALTTFGVRITVAGRGRLRSAAPLGFTPGGTSGEPPLLVTSDVAGLGSLAGLSGVYRTHSWLSVPALGSLHSWQMRSFEARLQRAQTQLGTNGSLFTLSGPFNAIDAARAQASAAPRRLLLVGGGALAALALFLVLAAGGLRRDQGADVARLRAAGARSGQCLMFVVGECGWLCAIALLAGAVLAVAVAALLATAAGLSAGAVLAHSLLTPVALLALAGGLICSTALLALLLLVSWRHAADVLAVAAIAALALALSSAGSGSDPLAVLLAPLCCLAGGVLVYRGAAAALRGGERLARRAPVLSRLALVGLARAPAAPSLAIAFIAVSIGLGGFALAYRATLLRGTADQAAARVPLDAIVAPGPDFTPPLQLVSLSRWRSLAGGTVLPVRRTDATYLNGGGTVTVPALGVPAAGLTLMHGWRASDGSAPLPALARRLVPAGPVRTPGPMLPAGTRSLSVGLSSPALAVSVSADLRDVSGAVQQVALGTAGPRPARLRAAVPPGSWELEALELQEPSGLEATNGHQNGENPAAATQFTAPLTIGPVSAVARSGVSALPVAAWRAVGAASTGLATKLSTIRGADALATGAGAISIRFQTSGQPGVLRPVQPSDSRPLPVLVDPQTAAAAAPGGRLALTIDGLPIDTRIAGVLKRFPTISSGDAGFIVADEATLAAALDAQQPGQGRADELWMATRDPSRLRAALSDEPLAQLTATFRGDIEHQLRSAPVARGVLGTLIAATALAGALAVIGLLVALLGAARDERVESDLVMQGMGPRGLRRELRMRMLLAGVIGVLLGLVIGLALTTLAVVTVRAAGTVAVPEPPLVTVAPWGMLVLWAIAAIGAIGAASWLATRTAVAR